MKKIKVTEIRFYPVSFTPVGVAGEMQNHLYKWSVSHFVCAATVTPAKLLFLFCY